jgi:hypothetical protein
MPCSGRQGTGGSAQAHLSFAILFFQAILPEKLHLYAARPGTSHPLLLSHLPHALASVLPSRLIFLGSCYHSYSYCSSVDPGALAPASSPSPSPLWPWLHGGLADAPLRVAGRSSPPATPGQVLHRHRQMGPQQLTSLFHKDKGDHDSNGPMEATR